MRNERRVCVCRHIKMFQLSVEDAERKGSETLCVYMDVVCNLDIIVGKKIVSAIRLSPGPSGIQSYTQAAVHTEWAYPTW